MTFRFPLLTALLAGCPCLYASSDPITLERYVLTSEKERSFSLPLDALTTTGSRLGLSHRDIPASASIITQEMMQLRGFRTAVEAVEGAVGMTGGTQFGSIPGYATRGFTGNGITILRDGIRQNTASQSSRPLDSFNLDRIEILKGPASLLFGEGAVGGAVNYLSKPPDRVRRAEWLVGLGAWNQVRAGLGAGGPLVPGRLFSRFDVSRSQQDGYVDGHRQRYTNLSGALAWRATDTVTVSLYGAYLADWNESYYGTPLVYDAVDRVDPITGVTTRLVARAVAATDRLVNARFEPAARRTNYNVTDNYAETENTFHRLRAEWTPSSDLELRNEVYVATQLLRWRNLETALWNPVTQRVDRSAFTHIYRADVLVGDRFDLTWRSTLAGRPSRLVAGAMVERNDLTRGGTPAGYATVLGSVSLVAPDVGTGPGDPNRFQKNARTVIATRAFFAEHMLELPGAVKLITGLRHDHIELTRDTWVTPATPIASTYRKVYRPWTGRAGLLWTVAEKVNLYASYSRAAEPVTQLVSFTAAQDNFSLQTGRQVEIGLKGSFAADRVDVTVALVDLEKNDLLSSTLDPDTGLRLSQQIGAQVSRGTEVAVAWTPSPAWRIEGNLAWTWLAAYRGFNENVGTGIVSRDGNRPPNVPEWVANVHVVRTLGASWRVSGGPRYVGERAANNANLHWSPGYTTLDAAVAYTAERWSLTVRGRNLLDQTYEEWASGFAPRLADPRTAECVFHTRF